MDDTPAMTTDVVERGYTALLQLLADLRSAVGEGSGSVLGDRYLLFDRPADGEATGGAGARLVDALFVAAATRRPLLLTGDPGTGKTQLGAALAAHLADGGAGASPARLVQFPFTSRTTIDDLLGGVDYTRRLADAQIDQLKDVDQYFDPGVFHHAFQRVAPVDPSDPEPEIVVVVLDEIDKADPALPNDLLDVLDRRRFRQPDQSEIEADTTVLTVITSNQERDLPEAFVRRCVVFTMDTPTEDDLVAIVGRHAAIDPRFTSSGASPDPEAWRQLAALFALARRSAVEEGRRPPATAEFLDAAAALGRLRAVDGRAIVDLLEVIRPLVWTKSLGTPAY